MQATQQMLLDVGVRPQRIQLEVFTSVGHEPLEAKPQRNIPKLLQLIVMSGLCVLYLVQSALDWGPPALADLQESTGYGITTGGLLIAFIAYQWYLPYLRLAGGSAQTASQWHSYLGVLAPVLLYLHSISLGIAYTIVLSLLFVLNTLVGAAGRISIRNLEQRRRFQRFFLLVHIPASCLVTVLALIHMVYALAYK